MTADAILERLDRGMRARLTLLLIPDGTPRLLRRWLAERTWPRVRVALTAADDGAGRFLASLARAFRPVVVAELPMGAADEEALLQTTGALLNALLSVEEDFALILENYHVITCQAVHAAVALMVEYPPPQMHLYVVSRITPPLPVARLRVRRQLVEIDLREGGFG